MLKIAPDSKKYIKVDYMGPDDGPFRCDNCEYYAKAGRCNNKDVIKELGVYQDGMAKVAPHGCCNAFSKKK